jgi:hypothetical protein
MDDVTLKDVYSRLGSMEAKIDTLVKASGIHSNRINVLELARAKVIGMAVGGSALITLGLTWWTAK